MTAKSIRAGSAKAPANRSKLIRATGEFQMLPGLGSFMPPEAKHLLKKGMYRGAPPGKTGIFDAKDVIPPTFFSEMYHQGQIPARVDMGGSKGGDDEEDGGSKIDKLGIKWKKPLAKWD